ncbi:protease [Amycolatopsis jiangsuensis]|uniref:DUF2269 family protein n=1 Tax=Amycolatopsis jiangsuensis TaxID=1181879 RepID=A0A840J6D2_9PSEU|nr:protease [Amycolatopsis jiangsuensis]MBB4688992.1 hypothetical protein [Amycolatopsis jiangsuensis]
MSKVLLSIHVVAAILAVGPVAVAASMVPPAIRRGDHRMLQTLYRICRVYAWVSLAVPVFGFAVAGTMKVTGDTWVLVSIGLTALAAAVLVLLMLPNQRAALAELAPDVTAEEPGGTPGPAATAEEPAAGPLGATGLTAGPVGVAGRAAGHVGAAGPPVRPVGAAGPPARPVGAAAGAPGAAIAPHPSAGVARLAARLGMTTGVFNLLWVVVTVIMIVRPGSSTGV